MSYFSVGDRVFCQKYGFGTVIDVDDDEVEYYDEETEDYEEDLDNRNHLIQFDEVNPNLFENDDEEERQLWVYGYEFWHYNLELAEDAPIDKDKNPYWKVCYKIRKMERARKEAGHAF